MADNGGAFDRVFIHISDIHFRGGAVGDVHDPDNELRNELEFDLRRLGTMVSKLDGLIISGDIAFSGKPEEYEYARSWIESIRELMGCGNEDVMLTPGNHDIDRSAVPAGGEVERLQRGVREAGSLDEKDGALAEILRDRNQGEALFRPLTAYNVLASAYSCQVSASLPYWERDYTLTDGTTLRLRGLTTSLFSSPNDDQQARQMFYGNAQRQFKRENNVRYAIVGHHPPSWTLEGDAADRKFQTRTCLQLFGHEHDQWCMAGGSSVRLIAGALHPDRREVGWQPRYAAVAVSVRDESHLALRVYPRRWSTEEMQFIPDGNSRLEGYRDFLVQVEPRVPSR